jgi:ABC-type uncharacterized transport system ATPase subunit
VGNQGDPHALGRWSPFTEVAIFITAAITFLTRFLCFEEALPVMDRIVVLRRGKKVADDIDPMQTTIESVENIIIGLAIRE